MRREVHREFRDRQGHICPIYPKEIIIKCSMLNHNGAKSIIIHHANIHP